MTAAIKKRPGSSWTVKCAVAAVLLCVVVLPILSMFLQITPADLRDVINNPNFGNAVWNSLRYTTLATLIVVVLAYLLAICTTRVALKGKRLLNIILILPMLIPSISHGMGLLILFGQNGILKNLIGWTFRIYGGTGIVLGSVMYALPVAYIMLADVLRYEDMSVYEAAEVLGIGKVRTFLRVSLPYMKKPLIAAAFSTFAMIVTDYGVPLMVSGTDNYTISTLMYQAAIDQQKFGRGAVYGVILLLPAIVAFLIDLLGKERSNSSFVTRTGQGSQKLLHKALSYAFCTLMSLFALLPIGVFAFLALVKRYPIDMTLTFDNFAYIFKGQGAAYLTNSLIIALITALVGVILGFVTAYLTARMRSPLSRGLHLLAISSMAIPGMVLGISYVMTFAATPIFGTLVILVMVNTAHFISSPYLMMYNSFGKMNENLEAVGQTLGIGRVRMLLRMFLPQSIGTLAEMFSYLFVNSMMTISAVSFLANTTNKPISLMISQFNEHNNEYVAVVSILILIVNIMIKIAVEQVKAFAARRK
ncbi:MAG: ABC transporter permease subunit [Clostridia bacterium]|nr:ABC transporter permease subunit [Clostridia bacterium]